MDRFAKGKDARLKATVAGFTMTGSGADKHGPFTLPHVRSPRDRRAEASSVHGPAVPQLLQLEDGARAARLCWRHRGDQGSGARGTDENGVRRAGGNPLTGPFYIEGAWPGDTLVIKLNRVRLNRDSAGSGQQIVPSALGPGYFRGLKFDEKFSSEWKLDRESGVPRLAKATDRLKSYTRPWRPMLGCIGVAPPQDHQFARGSWAPGAATWTTTSSVKA